MSNSKDVAYRLTFTLMGAVVMGANAYWLWENVHATVLVFYGTYLVIHLVQSIEDALRSFRLTITKEDIDKASE